MLEGTELTLNCIHNGSSVSWNLPNPNISQQSLNPLVIPNAIIEKDQGTYLCTVSNSLGN